MYQTKQWRCYVFLKNKWELIKCTANINKKFECVTKVNSNIYFTKFIRTIIIWYKTHFVINIWILILLHFLFQIDSNPANDNATNSHSQHHPGISRQELISSSGPRQNLSPSGSGHQPKLNSQNETPTDISPTKKLRLSEV